MPDGLRHDLQALFALADTVGVPLGRLLGLMLSRSGEVRVMLKGEPGDIASLLQRLGWTGDAAFAKRALDAVPVRTDGLRFVLGRGVSGGWNPDFGIEVFCADETEHEAVRGWLTGLLGQDRDRVQALEAWRGGAGFLDGGRLVHDFAVPTPGPNDLPSAAIKTVNHYKLNYAGGRLSEAKAYLSLASAS
jgi:hypothetical protein